MTTIWQQKMKIKSSKRLVYPIIKAFLLFIESFSKNGVIVLFQEESVILYNGGDYYNNMFLSFFEQRGIVSRQSCLYTPQQNGTAV